VKPFRKPLYDEQLARLGHVVDTLLPCYGLSTVQRTLLQHENNAVYRLVTTVGEQFVVRVANTWGRSEQEQRSEMQWLQALRRETSLVVPEPVQNLDGDLVTMIVTHGIVTEGIAPARSMEAHPCVVLRWVPGEPPQPGPAPALMERIGAFTAEMHRYSERFAPAAGFVRPRWDWERLFGAHSFLHDENIMTMLPSRQRGVLHAASEQIRRALSCPGKQALRQGHIHADLHRDNILIYNSEVGVIDFDDCGFGYYLFDIACVLDSFKRRVFADPAEYREGREALLRGYARIRPLASDFDEYLGIFMALRDMVILDFILRSKNPNVQEWGRSRVAPLIDQLRTHLDGNARL